MIQIIHGNTETKISINFNKAPFINSSKENLCCDTKWGLCFFETKPQNFNLSLALTSAALSASAYEEASICNNLQMLGFDDIQTHNYSNDTTLCGFSFGIQKWNDNALIGVFIRGTADGQWHTNFDLGTADYHNGFWDSARYLLDCLRKYFDDHNLAECDPDSIKFYVTGHSKGGAVANLVSARLIDNVGESGVYCYTFASPNVGKNQQFDRICYSGIFNLVSSNDFITACPLIKWGYSKFGTIIDLFKSKSSGEKQTIITNTKNAFKELTGGELVIFSTQNTAVEDFSQSVFDVVKNADEYYHKYFQVGNSNLSLYEYFTAIAEALDNSTQNNINSLDNMLLLMSSMATPLEPITQLVLQGTENDDCPSPVMLAHTCESYIALLMQCRT